MKGKKEVLESFEKPIKQGIYLNITTPFSREKWGFAKPSLGIIVIWIIVAAGLAGALSHFKNSIDGENIRHHGKFTTYGLAQDVDVSGDYAYVATAGGGSGLEIFDVTEKNDPKKVGHYVTDGFAARVVVSGDYAYVAHRTNGLVIVDITDKTDPRETGRYDTAGIAYGIAVAGDYAYVTDVDYYNGGWHNGDGLVIVDITNKSNPQKTGHYNASGRIEDVAVNGDYAYLDDYGSGLVIVDISNKSNPQVTGRYNTMGDARDVVVSGDYAYLTNVDNGLVIVDIGNKSNPQKVGHCDTAGFGGNVAVAGDYAYMAAYDNGLLIIDVSNKTDPQKAGGYDSDPRGLELDEN